MLALLLVAYCSAIAFLAWKNFRRAIGFFILLLPTYLIRFNVGSLPTTLLEITFAALMLGWLVRYGRTGLCNLRFLVLNNKVFSLIIILFFVNSLLGVFVSDHWFPALGQWRAYFLEPLLLFLILVGTNDLDHEDLINPLIISTISISLYALLQAATGWGIATPEWSATATRRVTSFFSSPNAIGLYLAPIMPLATYAAAKQHRHFFNFYFLIGTLSIFAVIFTKSVGTWLGLLAGALVFLFLLGYKRLVAGIVIIGCLLLPTTYKLQATKIQSTTNRLVLWSYTADFLVSSPKNFIFGSGIRQFYPKIQAPHRTTNVLEPLIYPHNIFLNFWTEVGLFGMLAFVGILYYLFTYSYAVYQSQDKLLGASFIAALTILMVHGLIDVPYFKNDLAMLFWIISSLIILNRKQNSY